MDLSDHEDGEVPADAAYDDADFAPTPSGSRPGGGASDGYHLTNVLKLPRATTYSTQSLYDQVVAGDINLEPEYQRDVVWTESKQTGLIDSILRNFYVPPIIFVAHQHEDGSETKTCIDGKQRLTSIHRFMDGLIPHRDPNTGTKFWYKRTSDQGARAQLLPDRYRRLFANKQMVCVEYQDLPDSEEREIFQRVQLGMALTPAEKLQVINSSMATLVRKIQSEYFYLGSPLDSEAFEWDRSRGGDFRCIAQALFVIAKFPAITSIAAVGQLEKWLHKPVTKARTKSKKKSTTNVDDAADEPDLSQDSAYLDRVHSTFRKFSDLVGDASVHSHFLRPEWRVSPIEFVMMCLLVSVNKDELSLEQLAARIGEMRVMVRKEHVDIRMNSRVAKTMFDFISECRSTTAFTSVLDFRSSTGGKRKREDGEDGEDVKALRSAKKKEKSLSVGLATPTAVASPIVPVLPPPRPDRLLAVREAKKTIAPPRVTQPGHAILPGLCLVRLA